MTVVMRSVTPFRAWRYNEKLAGDLVELIAPPYDVIRPDLQSRLYARSPYNVVRVDLGMTTPSDNDSDNQYTRSAAQLSEWKRRGILLRDDLPSVTFVEETFEGPDGRIHTRHGFLALVRLHDFEEGVVFPHEFTLSEPKEDRFRLMKSTGMSLSPVFLLYDLPGDEITAAFGAALDAGLPAFTVRDDAGTATKLWPTSDESILGSLEQNLAAARFIIADGHHRYETALRYRDYRRELDRLDTIGCDESPARENGPASSETSGRPGSPGREESPGRDDPMGCEPDSRAQAYEYALAYFSNMADSGLAIYGTHRLLSGLSADAVAALPESLAGTFRVERLAGNADVGLAEADWAHGDSATAEASRLVVSYLHGHSSGGAFGLAGPGLDAIYGIALADQEAAQAAVPDHSPAYRELDVTILQSLVLGRVLGITEADMRAEKHVTFVKDWNEAFRRLYSREFQVGFFMNPTRLDQIREVALGGERMPQKATFFYPKLPTGLVFHDLRGSV